MKLTEEKCHLLTFGTIKINIKIRIGEAIVEESAEEKLLGVIFDKKLNFRNHISSLCKKPGEELHTLARESTFMDPNEQLHKCAV